MLIAVIVSAATSGRQHSEDDGGLSPYMTEHLICSLDLLSTMYSCLPNEAVRLTAQFTLLRRLFSALIMPSVDQRVRGTFRIGW